VTFVKPDGTKDDIEVTALERGTFNFTYTPDVVGGYIVSAWWQSDKGYYCSAYSEKVSLEVRPQYIYAIAAIVVIVAIAIIVYIYSKRRKK